MYAGIMSLPHAIAVLGVACGSGVLVLVYLLARLSLAKLIRCNIACLGLVSSHGRVQLWLVMPEGPNHPGGFSSA